MEAISNFISETIFHVQLCNLKEKELRQGLFTSVGELKAPCTKLNKIIFHMQVRKMERGGVKGRDCLRVWGVIGMLARKFQFT